ncbi:hypothetical protein CLOHYLEM_05982 [[Clostridium] hylemonae DSM 15053]|uniref:Uncharacterized protein n=1 Tax=[Clostridium] hylemonae DSM 15053 TaxID=553973 RepID=C0C1G3_9FIRM|nr:hypothetical protein CLOHYLEM_05982 [[Clostridium] hylemonae DSM 15053]
MKNRLAVNIHFCYFCITILPKYWNFLTFYIYLNVNNAVI